MLIVCRGPLALFLSLTPSCYPLPLFVAYEMHKLLVSLAAAAASLVAASPAAWSEQTPLVVDDDVKVPVELGVMSKCPDALAMRMCPKAPAMVPDLMTSCFPQSGNLCSCEYLCLALILLMANE